MWYILGWFSCVLGGNCLDVRSKIRQVNPRAAFVFLSPSFVLWFFFPYFSPLVLSLIYRHIVPLQKSGLNGILPTGPQWLFQTGAYSWCGDTSIGILHQKPTKSDIGTTIYTMISPQPGRQNHPDSETIHLSIPSTTPPAAASAGAIKRSPAHNNIDPKPLIK